MSEANITREEATIQALKKHIEALNKIIKRRDKVIKELEQEPMQVELEGDGYADGFLVYDYGKCPKCGWQYEEGDKDWKEPFCCHCGQKLKWFNNESEASN